ncbi:hypothetical protein CesoFtcFv8_022697 [Champsocephalus esox]|uniref:Uncharacterized protein n=1 Tax=Champsocephalus esox TaxID=159716 RepID=A0AAN8B6P9_9TELE|nr:hypothetical protein CesoFtcFv8_022697 [Champsocephalus esox]
MLSWGSLTLLGSVRSPRSIFFHSETSIPREQEARRRETSSSASPGSHPRTRRPVGPSGGGCRGRELNAWQLENDPHGRTPRDLPLRGTCVLGQCLSVALRVSEFTRSTQRSRCPVRLPTPSAAGVTALTGRQAFIAMSISTLKDVQRP